MCSWCMPEMTEVSFSMMVPHPHPISVEPKQLKLAKSSSEMSPVSCPASNLCLWTWSWTLQGLVLWRQNGDNYAHHRKGYSPASLTGGESSCISPQWLIWFLLVQPVNLKADLYFSFYFNGFEIEPNHGELPENVLGLGHISLCTMYCILFLVLVASICGALLHFRHGAKYLIYILDVTSYNNPVWV